jgi:hypothetical protein
LQFGQFAAASLAEAVQHEPRSLLRDTDLFGYLHGGDTFAGRHHQVHRVNPLVQGYVRPLENRASTDGEIQLAFVATVEALALAISDAILTAARRAGGAFRPETALQVHAGGRFVGKHLEELKGADCRFAHGSTLRFRVDFGEKMANNLAEVAGKFGIVIGDAEKIETNLVLILARPDGGVPVCFDLFRHVFTCGSYTAIEGPNPEKAPTTVAIELVIGESLCTADKGVHGYIPNGEAVAGANASKSAEGGGFVRVGCKHLTVSGRLVASDVSKVDESRTNVKSYFQQKGLK